VLLAGLLLLLPLFVTYSEAGLLFGRATMRVCGEWTKGSCRAHTTIPENFVARELYS
jgi:hypothetical protein